MKTIRSFVFAALVSAPAIFAAPFEGKVTFKITPGRGAPQEMAYSIKGDKMRLELPSQAASGMGGVIFDVPKREVTIVMDSQQMYMVQTMPEPGATPPGDKSGETPTLEKTGEKEKILGFDAQKYVSTFQGSKTELWLAEGLGTFMAFSGGPMGGRGRGGPRGGGGGQAWERALAGKELFPLRVISHDKGGNETRMEATAIDKQSLPDSLFAPPAGYQKFDMGNMMRGMMPQGMRPPGGD
jgi:hypothetical protein